MSCNTCADELALEGTSQSLSHGVVLLDIDVMDVQEARGDDGDE